MTLFGVLYNVIPYPLILSFFRKGRRDPRINGVRDDLSLIDSDPILAQKALERKETGLFNIELK